MAASPSRTLAPSPYGPMSATQIANTIAGYGAKLPQPVGEGALQQRAQGMVDPLVQSISDRIGARAKAGSSAIGGYASKLAESLAPFQQNETNIWTQAQKSEAATDAALSSAQKGDGNALASELAGKLGQINAPQTSVDAYANSQATTGAGAGNALLARGSASLSDLISHGAASADYASKQPGIARSQGLTDIRDLNLASGRELADQTSQVQQQIPGIVAALRSENDQKRTNAANSKLDIFKFLTSRNDAIGAGSSKAALDAAKFATDTKYKYDALNATNTRAHDAAAATAARAKETAAARAAQTSFSNQLAFAKTYGYDPVTNQTLPGYTRDKSGQVVKLKTGGAKGHLTDAQTAKLVQQWHDGTLKPITTIARDDNGNKITNSSGAPETTTQTVPTGQMDYSEAYKMLRAFGKSDGQARQVLNTVYQRGDQGRSWVTNEEQAVLRAAGVKASATVMEGRAVLSQKQVTALRAAGVKLPPGQETAEGYYVIAPGH
jgi:hypothetical protein